MKQIKPIVIWNNGEEKTATILTVTLQDNMVNFCSFYYQLCEGGQGTEEMPLIQGNRLSEGNKEMSGETYLNWDGSNETGYAYIAEKLNLTLIA
jgi:hypothetical protein